MILYCYAVKDDKVSFSNPFFFEGDNVALRSFVASVRSPERNNCNLFPEDKSLWRLGSYDNQTGQFKSLKKPVCLGYASAYIVNTPTPHVERGVEIEPTKSANRDDYIAEVENDS